MIYVLVWFHFIRADHLQYYQFQNYPSKEECEVERNKALMLVTSTNMLLECVEMDVSGRD
tara:strand:+ start:246 stop:425 length:180 start_codon:yes stop_codon:yes gene_type:complete